MVKGFGVKNHSDIELEEYLDLIKRYADSQYSMDTEPILDYDEYYNITLEQEITKQAIVRNDSGVSDLTNASDEEIEKNLHIVGGIRIGNFEVKVNCYMSDNEGAKIRFRIYEIVNRIHRIVIVPQDYRFKDQDWAEHFKPSGKSIPIGTAVDIIRYLGAISKLSVFV